MKKIELPSEHVNKINFAVKEGLGIQDWEPISLLSGGLTGIPVYRIEVDNKSYAIKLENVNDKNFDLVRNYKIIESVSQQGISPLVYFTDAEHGIILMKYIESKPRPENASIAVQKLAGLIRNLHDKNSFSKWKSVLEILDYFYQQLPAECKQKIITKKCMQEIKKLENILFDPKDIRSCHCDLNPVNILFDGDNYYFVDWQAASPQSFYFDLAYCVNFFFFYSEELCASFLTKYFGREATEDEKAKYYLMRVFSYIYSGIGFISLSLKADHLLSDEDIQKLPTYLEFMQSIGSGKTNLSDPDIQQQFGFVFLKAAEGMMNKRYQYAYELLSNSFI